MTSCVKTIFTTLILLITQFTFAQSITLEDKIYNTVDAFVANPNEESLKKLESFSKNISTLTKNKNELLALVVLHCNKAYYENQFNQLQKAVSSYETAWKTYQKYHLKDYDIVEFCLKPLGNLYTIIGDYDNAENTIKQYYYIATQQKNQQQQYAAVLNLSNVYQNSGRINEAIDLLEKTIRNEKLSNTQKGILLNNLGNNYLLRNINKDPSNAENSFLKAIPLLKQDKSQQEALINSYLNLYKLSINFRRNEALNYYEKARVIFENLHNKSPRYKAQFYLEKIHLLLEQNKLTETQTVLKTVFKTLIPNYSIQKGILPKKNDLYAETILLDALDFQAELFSIQNRPKKALESYTLAFHIEDLFQNLIVYENSKIITQTRNRKRIEKCVAIYQSLFEKEKNQSYIEDAFQLVEKTKSVVLKERVKNNFKTSFKEKALLQQLENQNTTILKEQQKGDLANIETINKAIQKQNELMLQLKQIQVKTSEKLNKNINLNDLYTQLKKDDAIMVEYFCGTEKAYSFTIQNSKISMRPFCYDISMICNTPIITFISFFHNANTITEYLDLFKKEAFATYRVLQLPKKTNHKNLIIIPDGILNFLPFEALITKESSTTNFAQMHYLLNDYNIGYQNSAQFYLAADQNKKQQKETVLGIFPVFENTPYTLTYSKDELHSIQKNFNGKYFQNTTATFKNFKKNAADYGILHLSTHASSGDIETPASIKFYDQEILYSELYHLNLNPDLVVLSACETGIGKLFKGEGSMSIARGFQFAGAQNLLFSLWKVNDYTTSIFMDSFYQNIKNGQSYLEANANAKRDFLKNSAVSNAKKSPYYWSAFVYYGDLQTNNESNTYIFYIFGILILIGLLLIFNRYRK
ncbi:tetratricopeptide repeat domain protein [Flavobacterium palustre]|uniref:Tetratricopeptide repeat domain protein n=1 Tax=Flavobacterium palustre TaxID=1476463 RepID=A0ABQ1H8S4_9FLAO|nr:tetratricopeptide repeat domain protein [Flavobacterium palustre]